MSKYGYLFPVTTLAQKYEGPDGRLRVALAVNPYAGDRPAPRRTSMRTAIITGRRRRSAECWDACPSQRVTR